MARDRRELTDEQWARLAPLLPPAKPARGRPTRDLRRLVEGIVCWMRAGLPWRDLPVAGDQGFSSRPVRAYLRRRGIGAVIPTRRDQRRNSRFDRAAYRQSNRVERTINRLKQFRRVATRYEKRAVHYLAVLTLASILLWV